MPSPRRRVLSPASRVAAATAPDGTRRGGPKVRGCVGVRRCSGDGVEAEHSRGASAAGDGNSTAERQHSYLQTAHSGQPPAGPTSRSTSSAADAAGTAPATSATTAASGLGAEAPSPPSVRIRSVALVPAAAFALSSSGGRLMSVGAAVTPRASSLQRFASSSSARVLSSSATHGSMCGASARALHASVIRSIS